MPVIQEEISSPQTVKKVWQKRHDQKQDRKSQQKVVQISREELEMKVMSRLQ